MGRAESRGRGIRHPGAQAPRKNQSASVPECPSATRAERQAPRMGMEILADRTDISAVQSKRILVGQGIMEMWEKGN